MNALLNWFIFAVLLLASAKAAVSPPSDATDIVIGKRHTIRSTVFGTERALRIYTPRGYELDRDSFPRVPVLYVLDGTVAGDNVASLVDGLSFAGRMIPPMVVVAIEQAPDRFAELTPTKSVTGEFGRPNDRLRNSGGAPKLVQFIREEVIPYVESNYRTAPFRILSGNSAGGLFVLYAMLEHPDMFHAYVASTPSLWWDDRVLVRRAGSPGRAGHFLFLSVANEHETHRKAIQEFAAVLRMRATADFQWEFKEYEAEWHGSVYHRTLPDALRFIYPDWNLAVMKVLATDLTYDRIAAHYAALSHRYGYEIPVPAPAIATITAELRDRDKAAQALKITNQFADAFPKSARAQSILAAAYADEGDVAAAIAQYEKTLLLAPNNVPAKRALERLRSEAK